MSKIVEPEKGGFTRRKFLSVSWVVAVFGILGQSMAGLWAMFNPRIVPGSFGSVVPAGNVEEFQPGAVSHVAAGRFYVTRVDEGFLAMWQRCTHLGCTIPWDEAAGEFRCPCHSTVFNIRGEVISGPAPRPMDLFPVEIRDGEIFVDTSRVIERYEFAPNQVTPA